VEVHGDIKPSNVGVLASDVYVLDVETVVRIRPHTKGGTCKPFPAKIGFTREYAPSEFTSVAGCHTTSTL
jgi:hypothetical protein